MSRAQISRHFEPVAGAIYYLRFIFLLRTGSMLLTVEATYENGLLKPTQPLPLREHETVRLTIQQGDTPLLRAYGILGWTGDHETLERVALDPEFLLEESP
jgi:predicted DNA-binding antitoxin AbrB/MazE fold protein